MFGEFVETLGGVGFVGLRPGLICCFLLPE